MTVLRTSYDMVRVTLNSPGNLFLSFQPFFSGKSVILCNETGFLVAAGQASGDAHSDNDSALINAEEPFWQLDSQDRVFSPNQDYTEKVGATQNKGYVPLTIMKGQNLP